MKCALALLFLVAPVLAMPSRAAACDRAGVRPWEALGRADLVVRATVTSVPAAGPVLVQSLEALVGKAPAAPFEVDGFARGDTRLRCGGTPPRAGDALLLLLYEPRGAVKRFSLIDEVDGAVPLASPQASALLGLVKERASTPFVDAGPGLAVKLFASSQRVPAGANVDLAVLLRNTGEGPLQFSYRDWPREAASACRITATRDGVVIPSRRNPISDADIADFFSKHGRSYELALAPGEAREFLLPRFHTAAPGWGYKEEQDFLFQPLEAAGRYELVATCRNLPAPGRTFTTPPLPLVVP